MAKKTEPVQSSGLRFQDFGIQESGFRGHFSGFSALGCGDVKRSRSLLILGGFILRDAKLQGGGFMVRV